MASGRAAAELLFERYLRANGYDWEHEPDLGIQTVPDFRITRSGVEVICEVKQFTTQAIRELGEAAGGPVVVPPRLLYRTIRAQLDSAARQLRPLVDRGLPLVVVLANPSRATVLLEPPTLFHAMYGEGGPVAPDTPVPSFEHWPFPTPGGRDGALTAKHGFISAVLALQTRRDPGAQFDAPPVRNAQGQPYMHVVDTLSDSAARLPTNVFNAPGDARWSPDGHKHYKQVAGDLRPGSVPEPDA